MSGIISDNQTRASGLVKSGATTYDDDKVQANLALLGFKTALNGSLAKYNLVDQTIDEFSDASGVDAGASTNETLTSGVYHGTATVTPSVTEDADVGPSSDGDYTYYGWTDTASTGSYVTDTTQDHEYLIVAGGGAGSYGSNGGGGGAGGYQAATGLSLIGGNTYTITVGAGGASPGSGGVGNSGANSILSGTGITTLTSIGGGGGAAQGTNGADGGSGGGASYTSSLKGDESANPDQGYDGGSGVDATGPAHGAAGGGGAGAVGGNGSPSAAGVGGVGVSNDITGSAVYYAGGGGGSTNSTGGGAGGNGGGGAGHNSSAVAGSANTGGGGGGANGSAGGAGGSGVVYLRRLTSATGVGNLTLQSTDTTASTANPDYADMVVLMENNAGTATLNTDIKGYISEDSGSTFTEGTFVEEGSWGTNKKIIAFHDLDISAQSGSSMCYKITTHNQSAAKTTKIHAVSIGWK